LLPVHRFALASVVIAPGTSHKEFTMRHRSISAFVLGTVVLAGAAQAQVNPFATVYSPNDAGSYALVVLCPGFIETQSAISAAGQRLATHGFVVATIDTVTTIDFPASRGTQLIAALRTITALNTGPVAGKIDTTRLVVGGHSMGGGGTLEASRTNPAIKAGLPIAPFHFVKQFNTPVPQLITGGQVDAIAPVGQHAIPFFEMLPDATPKIYAELTAGNHFFVTQNPPNQPINKLLLAWTKRFADNDLRYEQFLAADAVQAEVANGGLSQTRREATPF
jgi:triacylglycerol lipase